MVGLLIAGGIILLIIVIAVWNHEECPRMILGYNCRGKNCDHSEELVRNAKQTMEGNKYHDHEQGQTS